VSPSIRISGAAPDSRVIGVAFALEDIGGSGSEGIGEYSGYSSLVPFSSIYS